MKYLSIVLLTVVMAPFLLLIGKCGNEVRKNNNAASRLLEKVQKFKLPEGAELQTQRKTVGNFQGTGNQNELLAYRVFTFSGDINDVKAFYGSAVQYNGFGEDTSLRDIPLGVISFKNTLDHPVPYPIRNLQKKMTVDDRTNNFAIYSRIRYSSAIWDWRGR